MVSGDYQKHNLQLRKKQLRNLVPYASSLQHRVYWSNNMHLMHRPLIHVVLVPSGVNSKGTRSRICKLDLVGIFMRQNCLCGYIT